MLGRIYADTNFISAAVLTLGSPAETHDLTVIDRTAGVEVDIDGIGVQTLRPAVAVQASALVALGLDAGGGDADDANLALNGTEWRVTAARPEPGPAGEAVGEYLLLLEKVS